MNSNQNKQEIEIHLVMGTTYSWNISRQ